MSALIWSDHLFGGLPLGLLFGKSCLKLWYTSDVFGFLQTCPNYFILLILITSTIVFSDCVILRMSTFLILSRLETPIIDLRHLISKTFSLFSSFVVRTHVSDAYMAIGRMSARKSLIFSLRLMFRLFHTLFRSLPKAVDARAILRSMSVLTSGTELPRKTKSLILSILFPWIVM